MVPFFSLLHYGAFFRDVLEAPRASRGSVWMDGVSVVGSVSRFGG